MSANTGSEWGECAFLEERKFCGQRSLRNIVQEKKDSPEGRVQAVFFPMTLDPLFLQSMPSVLEALFGLAAGE